MPAAPADVVALLRRPTPAARAAVAAGDPRPAEVREAQGSWHDALSVAAGAAEWLWLVEGDAVPDPGALGRLLDVAADPADLPAPSLLASKVVDPSGRLHPRSEPWLPLLDRDIVIAAARRRLASLRMARWGSLLVSAAAIAEHGPPRANFDGGADDLEWTARILRDGRGYLVPASRVTRAPAHAGPRPAAEVRDRLRMVRGTGFVAQEPVWFAFMVAVDAVQDVQRAPRLRTAAPYVRGLAAAVTPRARS